MEAAQPLEGNSPILPHHLRSFLGAPVVARTTTGDIHGTLLSCTTRSAWIVVGDVDHVVALAHLRSIRHQ
ncbi:MAG: hypothetical protein EXQ71_03245 [Acidimicrobiia bacterium]|nr:hypothetical protein [Acidimicrobiia bacterium]